MEDFASQVSGVSALAEPARRALYGFVTAQPDAVSRDQAAAGTGLPRHTAKFHLDKLVEQRLLDVEFRRLTGRRGPGAGRPTKLYRRSGRQIELSLPERRYALAGQILAAAIEESARSGIPVADAVRRAAARAGRRAGTAARTGDGSAPTAVEALAALGYEPRPTGEQTVTMANCPFHDLAREHTALTCEMNVHLIGALLDELGGGQRAALDPGPGRCCVTLTGDWPDEPGRSVSRAG